MFDIYKDNLNIILPYLIGVIMALVNMIVGMFTTLFLATISIIGQPIPIIPIPPFPLRG